MVRRRPKARRDLIEIWNYIADRSEPAANRFLEEAEKTFSILADYPEAGRARSEVADGMRRFPVGKYMLFYRVADDSIIVTRVVSAYRDIEFMNIE